MSRNCDYAVVRLRNGTYRLDRVTEPAPGPIAIIMPVSARTDRLNTPIGWRLKPLVCVLGSRSKLWPTPAEAVASTKLMTPGQARSAVAAADAGEPS